LPNFSIFLIINSLSYRGPKSKRFDDFYRQKLEQMQGFLVLAWSFCFDFSLTNRNSLLCFYLDKLLYKSKIFINIFQRNSMKKFLLSSVLVASVLVASVNAAVPVVPVAPAVPAKTWTETLESYTPQFVIDGVNYVEASIVAHPKVAVVSALVAGYLIAKAVDYASASNVDESGF
jgi:hypothetical protein